MIDNKIAAKRLEDLISSSFTAERVDKGCFSYEIVELTRLMPSYKSETVFFYDWKWLIMFRVQCKQASTIICIANNL